MHSIACAVLLPAVSAHACLAVISVASHCLSCYLPAGDCRQGASPLGEKGLDIAHRGLLAVIIHVIMPAANSSFDTVITTHTRHAPVPVQKWVLVSQDQPALATLSRAYGTVVLGQCACLGIGAQTRLSEVSKSRRYRLTCTNSFLGNISDSAAAELCYAPRNIYAVAEGTCIDSPVIMPITWSGRGNIDQAKDARRHGLARSCRTHAGQPPIPRIANSGDG
ncbi:uncharacterized protein F5Z01DRAFT_695929 [Emericellopsis atlantica]|uniref:Uncharacterized protein n=1 Tax=Emericellopsis atlantica TaxID=2614577 RepID=A0A9P8CLR1_9HYPO|nr:uncharacterized protein F5Z01DRAFT_695929 [Emericellopsis atlantica]KAG9249871.1 hypothetical protein F5Z01DRAFT_695929 [Emericellopsis atlantica]